MNKQVNFLEGEQYWGFELRPSYLLGRCSATWATLPALFLFGVGYFQDRVSWTISLGWLETVTLLISVSQVGSIIGVSHQRQADKSTLETARPGSEDMVIIMCYFPYFLSSCSLVFLRPQIFWAMFVSCNILCVWVCVCMGELTLLP
jgi:hypothetical protein